MHLLAPLCYRYLSHEITRQEMLTGLIDLMSTYHPDLAYPEYTKNTSEITTFSRLIMAIIYDDFRFIHLFLCRYGIPSKNITLLTAYYKHLNQQGESPFSRLADLF